jgi:hypothetical protein
MNRRGEGNGFAEGVMRGFILVVGVSGLVASGCGAKSNGTSCPAGYECIPIEGGTGGTGGATAIATQIQLTPWQMASDGTTLYWLDRNATALSSMPVGGGSVKTLMSANVTGGLLAVDDANVYFEGVVNNNVGIFSMPKGGGQATTIVAGSNTIGIGATTTLGPNVYWTELMGGPGPGPGGGNVLVMTAPLKGGTPTQVASFTPGFGPPNIGSLGVTANTLFVGTLNGFDMLPIGDDGGAPTKLSGVTECEGIVSSNDAAYCCPFMGTVSTIASNGTVTSLGMSVNATGMGLSSPIAVDATYVYWVDFATVGTIMRAPKTGGTASIIARDTSPVAIAVDDKAVYWSDIGGNIMRLPK